MDSTTHAQPAKQSAVVLLGPTGSGKTPLGKMLERRGLWGKDCVHFDFGCNLRRLVSRNVPTEHITRHDIEVLRSVLGSGALLEDEHFPLAARILKSFLSEYVRDERTVVVLNGLPRHTGQAKAMDNFVRVQAVLHLDCTSDVIFARIRSNVGGDRAGRLDDDLQAVQHKLELYNQRTLPLVEYYRGKGVVVQRLEVTSTMTPEQMWQTVNCRPYDHERNLP